jgi:hypothetical protein
MIAMMMFVHAWYTGAIRCQRKLYIISRWIKTIRFENRWLTLKIYREVQQRLANDIYDVQKELASNATISALTQQQLLDNGNQEVHYALAGNRNLTGPIMAQLAEI